MEENKQNKKPQVIPNVPEKDLIEQANETNSQIAKQMEYEGYKPEPLMSDSEFAAAMEMAKRRDAEKKSSESGDKIVRPELADTDGVDKNVKISYGSNENPKSVISAMEKKVSLDQPLSFSKPNIDDYIEKPEVNTISIEEPFDLIPLPSEGKIYKHKKSHLKVAYMNASDEDILTNPNLLESGKVLDVLFERKIKEQGVNYKDLHVGDRNAIMLWLRATAYGNNYPVELIDPKTGEPFKLVVDLSELKTKKLKENPDNDGLFTLELSNGDVIKYKLLSIGDESDIENHTEELSKNEGSKYDVNTYVLKKHVVSVNGNMDRKYVDRYVEIMRIMDSRMLKNRINEIESGIDMRINVTTPGGESIKSFLPLNLSFFWPDFGA